MTSFLRLGSGSLADILPAALRNDKKFQALALALDSLTPRMLAALPPLLIWARLWPEKDSAAPLDPVLTRIVEHYGLPQPSDALLEYMAWQLHVDGYEAAPDYAGRLAMVRESIPIHRIKGTPAAVEEAAGAALHRDVLVREWFEYGGNPYFFRVRFDVSGLALDKTQMDNVFRLIWETKNTRSWLEAVETYSVTRLPMSVGVGLAESTITRSTLYFPPPPPSPLRKRIGAAVSHVTASRIRTISPPRPASPTLLSPRMAVSSVTRCRLAVSARQEAL